ncbi:MAG TPA: hypothetical protein VGR13_00555 [Actinomycetota bacterium]|jgi:hypothetical protein|nr:hypothetical protein [Actinomycetota bacterium]
MAKVIAGMTTSLDGFVADQNGSVARLYPDLTALRGTDYMKALIEETGAVLMGEEAFEMAEDPDWYVGNYEFQVLIFVLTHELPGVPPKQDEHLTFIAGLRLFENSDLEGVQLEKIGCEKSGRERASGSAS